MGMRWVSTDVRGAILLSSSLPATPLGKWGFCPKAQFVQCHRSNAIICSW